MVTAQLTSRANIVYSSPFVIVKRSRSVLSTTRITNCEGGNSVIGVNGDIGVNYDIGVNGEIGVNG